ncbi:S-methyl-5'-thioadenosine phosphorylase [Kribbella solani]|uniref:S-methyl-5'-thioadenosine phosphorylase n=1 Tax=Kribbella solani TaxID=236067 RepID=UPI0029A0A82A|nr:S-methyl-5'-thioadenosine phosphorylase [Kribbella solani]MDX2974040.1 S-methyl-5'-thioadenosine phosphorylase [Kribbella solani]MDX3001877.1 S-methyl-5'-thioadenosine phosphorylase [Kribbella solani]
MADIGVLGGSGFYSFLSDVETIAIDTPFGPPSEHPVIGELGGRQVAFIPRHGADHRFPPHRVNYRANLWALRALGVRQVLAPCAVGSLRPELTPGTFVVPDQYVDRTWGRPHTVYDGAPVVHTSAADPYCPAGRATVIAFGNVVPEGTMVVINGPRFSTRAESRWHAAQGWSVVGMTGAPEAAIARELALCYTSVAVITDHDAGVETGSGVTQAEVFAAFTDSIERLQTLLKAVITQLPDADCSCRHSLDGTAAAEPVVAV